MIPPRTTNSTAPIAGRMISPARLDTKKQCSAEPQWTGIRALSRYQDELIQYRAQAQTVRVKRDRARAEHRWGVWRNYRKIPSQNPMASSSKCEATRILRLPTEGAWAAMKNSLGNLGSCSSPRQLAAIVKNRLKRIQYRPALIDGFLAQTGLSIQPEPP